MAWGGMYWNQSFKVPVTWVVAGAVLCVREMWCVESR